MLPSHTLNEILMLILCRVVADTIGTTDGYDISGNNNYAHDLSVQNGDEVMTPITYLKLILSVDVSLISASPLKHRVSYLRMP